VRLNKPWKTTGLAMIAGLIFATAPLRAQTVTATVAAGPGAHGVAVNPVTNKIYVANGGNGTVTVIDGATNATTTVTVGTNPYVIAVNTITNQIYVANNGSAFVTVIDGATNATTNVPAGANQRGLSVNPITNKIYVANGGSNTVTVIDGATNATTTIAAGTFPNTTAVNPVTNQIYVANENSSTVTVIDGATNNTTTLTVLANPVSLAVNPVTNKIYVSYLNVANVTVIDGVTNNLTTVAAGTSPYVVVVNPVTNMIYTANNGSNTVTAIDGATNAPTTIEAGTGPFSLGLNSMTNQLYVANLSSGNVTVIDGATSQVTTTLTVGSNPQGIGVNPVTNKIYVANGGSGNVSVIDGATNTTATVTTGNSPIDVAVNTATNQIYVTNYDPMSNILTIIDGATNNTTSISDPNAQEPYAVAVNPVTNKIYVANYGSVNVTVIDGVTNSVTTVAAASTSGNPVAVAVNPVTNQIYVAGLGGHIVTVIDGATNNTTAVTVGTSPTFVAVNPVTNQIYVANESSANVTVLDGATNNTTNVPVGTFPVAVAVNTVTNKIYVANEQSNNVSVIDGLTNAVTTVSDPNASGPIAVAVNPVTNKIYVANYDSGNMTVIDGATNTTTTVAVGGSPSAVAVNSVTNKIYVANLGTSNVTVIDGVTNATTKVAAGLEPDAVAVNPVTNRIYVANDENSSTVTVITEDQVQPIPLTTTITPLTGNTTTNPTPTFTFLAASTFAPTAPTPDALYFQFDTYQGPWTAATPNALTPGYSGTAPTLSAGMHILYAYATDGQDASSTHTGGNGIGEDSPLIGNIAAYVFTVLPPAGAPPTASLNPTTLTFPAQAVGIQSAFQTMMLTNTGGANLVLAAPAFAFGGVAGGDYVAVSGTTCSANLSVAPNGTCIVNVAFMPAATGSRPATLTFTDNSGGTAGSTQQVVISGTGTTGPPVASVNPASLTFASQVLNTTSAAQAVTLTNTGGSTLMLGGTSAILSGPNAGDFGITPNNTCTASALIQPTASCSINISFTPTAVGLRTATLTFMDDSGLTASTQTVTLTGTGGAAGGGGIAFSGTTLSFGTVPLADVIIQDQGGMDPNTLGFTGESGGTAPGSSSNGMWDIPAGPWNTNYDVYNLTAANLTDLTAASGYIYTVTFNDLSANTSPTFPGAPYSYGEDPIVSVNNLRYDLEILSDGNGGQLDVINPFDANSPTSDIPGLGTNPVTLTVVFNNSTQLANSYINGVQVITGYAGDSTTFTCNCVAFGGELGDFSNVELVSGLPNPNAILPLTVTNSGSAPLTFSVPATITGTNAGDFTFAPASTCAFGTPLAVGNSCVVNILFLPTGTGVRTATLTFFDNANPNSQTITLTGVGQAAAAPANITATGGTPQSATVNTAFAAPLAVTVTDVTGAPVPGVVVTFSAPTAGASGTFAGGVNTATTGANGVASSAVFTANATVGTFTVTATVAGVDSSATFSLTNNTAAAPVSITATSGTPQSTTINAPFAAPFVVSVKTAAGAPVSGASVSFNTPEASGANGTFPGNAVSATVTTNANGLATSPILTANNFAGTYTVTAFVLGTGLSANFALTNNNPTPILTSISPTTGTVGQPVTLTLTGSNFVSGVIVNFGGNADTGAMPGDGTLTITIPASQLSEAGPVSVTVSNPAPTAGPSAPQTFTITNSNSSNLVIAINGTITVPSNTLTFTFPVQSVNGLAGALTTTCSSPAVGCLVSPCPAPLIANRSVTLTGTLFPLSGGTVVGSRPTSLPGLRLPLGWRLSLAYLACLLLVGLLSARKQSVRWGMAVAALTFALLAGCGGGGSTAPQGSVAAGQYNVTITATLGNATQTAQVTVKVQ